MLASFYLWSPSLSSPASMSSPPSMSSTFFSSAGCMPASFRLSEPWASRVERAEDAGGEEAGLDDGDNDYDDYNDLNHQLSFFQVGLPCKTIVEEECSEKEVPR